MNLLTRHHFCFLGDIFTFNSRLADVDVDHRRWRGTTNYSTVLSPPGRPRPGKGSKGGLGHPAVYMSACMQLTLTQACTRSQSCLSAKFLFSFVSYDLRDTPPCKPLKKGSLRQQHA